MVSSLSKVVDASFIRRFAGAAQGSSSSLTSSTSASKTTLSSGLRFGAQTYATAIQSLNTTISFVNVSHSTLEKLSKLTDKMISYAKTAADASGGEDSRRKASVEYRKLVTQFRDIVSNAKLGDTELLTIDGLTDLLARTGLDAESSDSIKRVLTEFVHPREDDSLASEKEKGKRPLDLPISSGFIPYYDDPDQILDGDIRTRADAYRALSDLTALKGQMKDNMGALEDVRAIIGQNIQMVRTAGLAFLEVAKQIPNESDAEKVAKAVQAEIRRNAGAALAQADNLTNIAAATLALLESS